MYKVNYMQTYSSIFHEYRYLPAFHNYIHALKSMNIILLK